MGYIILYDITNHNHIQVVQFMLKIVRRLYNEFVIMHSRLIRYEHKKVLKSLTPGIDKD